MNGRNVRRHNQSFRTVLRGWLPRRRRRHDPWLACNIATFTFGDRTLRYVDRFGSRSKRWN